MKLTLELSTSQIIQSTGFQQPVTSLRQKYGEGARIEILVLREGLPITPTELEEFVWVIKPVGKHGKTHILGGCETFTWDAGIDRFVGVADYNVDALKELLKWDDDGIEDEEPQTVDLWAELSWRVNSSAGWQRCQITDFQLENVLFKGDETFPASGTPLEVAGPWLSPRVVTISADVVNNDASANTIADITDLKFPVETGHRYHFRFTIPYTTAATTTGARFSVTGPASPTELRYRSSYPLTVSTETINHGMTSYDEPAASNASCPSGGGVAVIEGFIKPSADGYVQARFASEVSASAVTSKAGACVQFTRLD